MKKKPSKSDRVAAGRARRKAAPTPLSLNEATSIEKITPVSAPRSTEVLMIKMARALDQISDAGR